MRWAPIRDITLFFAGLAGVFHETVLTHTERPTLLLLFAAMMGLPVILKADDTVKKHKQSEDDE